MRSIFLGAVVSAVITIMIPVTMQALGLIHSVNTHLFTPIHAVGMCLLHVMLTSSVTLLISLFEGDNL